MSAWDIQAKLLRKLIRAGPSQRVEKALDRLHPAEIASLMGVLSPGETKRVVEVLFSRRRAGKTLLQLPTALLRDVLALLEDSLVCRLLERLPPDDGALFMGLLGDSQRVERVLGAIGEGTRGEIRRLLTYPKGTAGAIMTPRFLALEENAEAQRALEAIREASEESESFYIHVVDGEGRLVGVVPLDRLVRAKREAPLHSIMLSKPVAVNDRDPIEKAAQVVTRYNLLSVPVKDGEGKLVGVITVDDVIDVIHDEATEDMYKMAGLSNQDRVFSPVWRSFTRRLPWLLISLGTVFLSASVIGYFEDAISQVVILAAFLPIVAAVGGNTGSQALVVVTRAMALGEAEFSTALRTTFNQTLSGLLLGVVVGLFAALIAYLWKGNVWLSLILMTSLLINTTVGGLIGAVIPFLLRHLNLDPALGSGVIVTTMADICGFFSFLGLSTLLMSYLLG